jgi:hypothetical protein
VLPPGTLSDILAPGVHYDNLHRNASITGESGII